MSMASSGQIRRLQPGASGRVTALIQRPQKKKVIRLIVLGRLLNQVNQHGNHVSARPAGILSVV